ncbi:sensor histidine kinase [Limnochorda pilosa]|uniref:sensor histidine kinase n=1 Tax=Limnochorda pilosa TaxID=1555112 RepID=UPI0011873780|nr:GAF domain-containing protein [Limnochorda pilosa]
MSSSHPALQAGAHGGAFFARSFALARDAGQAERALEGPEDLEQRVEERTRELARSLETSQRQADEMRTLLAIQRALTGADDPQDVLQRIADEARRLTGARRALIFLVDGDDLAVTVWSGEERPEAVAGFRMPIRSSATGRMMLSGEPVRIADARRDRRINPEIHRRTGFRSLLSVPLLSGSTPVGAISCADKIEGTFDDVDERVLSMLASGAVLGIQNARLHRTERERRREAEERRRVAESLRDTLALLNSDRPLEEILKHLVRQAADLLGTDTGALYRLHPDGRGPTIQAVVGLPEEHVASMAMPVGMAAVGKAMQERRPVVIPDMAQVIPPELAADPELRRHLEGLVTHFRGILGLPVAAGTEVYGGFVLYYREPRTFSKEELATAGSLGDQAALAIQNARLRSQAEASAAAAERSRLARDLHDAVTQTLFSANLIAEVLPRLWERKPEEGWRRLEELRQLTRGALAEMRTLLLELRPAALVEAKLPDLLRHLAEAVTGRARIPVDLRVEGERRLAPDVQVALYRIAQEALNNVAHHAAAGRAEVDLRCSPGGVALRVRDDGRGFDPASVAPQHLGLGIMRERAQAIGARIRIESQAGRGTDVVVEWEEDQGVGGR